MERSAVDARYRQVPRFYFHLYNDIETSDEEGVELADLKAARLVALINARFTAAESIKEEGHFVPTHRIDIENEQGQVLDTVYFGDAVEIEG